MAEAVGGLGAPLFAYYESLLGQLILSVPFG